MAANSPPTTDLLTGSNLTDILDFLRRAEGLKIQMRSGFTSIGRPESVAEHTWRLSLWTLVVADAFPEVDHARLVKLCLIHDLGEALNGDIPAPMQRGPGAKAHDERQDLLALIAPLPDGPRNEILGLWDEYEANLTPEARLAKALDKLETILQHNQGDNPADFDYRFNLGYGQQYTQDDPRIVTIRQILDAETEARAVEAAQNSPKLEALLAGITDENLHPEQDFGPPVGAEEW
ncbi:MAG: HD domain-containing protein [Caldilineaceae bacterium]|nr:HD domain-containing protein [Caldilineaceae bacterium]MBP8106826.1 HD domain-containing protein [Caldilineaceae bacterium]MBP8121720.1 HD domain-containing protein [Caldilineaceae bacterium]MBP9071490.1 HD domain-containing protein [Caldilineaceae bacterium]